MIQCMDSYLIQEPLDPLQYGCYWYCYFFCYFHLWRNNSRWYDLRAVSRAVVKSIVDCFNIVFRVSAGGRKRWFFWSSTLFVTFPVPSFLISISAVVNAMRYSNMQCENKRWIVDCPDKTIILPSACITRNTHHNAQLASLLGATGWGTNLGNLLQGGEAYVKVFADFSPFPATVCLLVAQRPKQKRNDMTTKSTLIKSILMHFLILFWGYRSICLKSITLAIGSTWKWYVLVSATVTDKSIPDTSHIPVLFSRRIRVGFIGICPV